jgi:hypothetical protein
MSSDDAHDEGYDAYWEDVDVTDNPCDEETEERQVCEMDGRPHEDKITMRARGER